MFDEEDNEVDEKMDERVDEKPTIKDCTINIKRLSTPATITNRTIRHSNDNNIATMLTTDNDEIILRFHKLINCALIFAPTYTL